MTSSRDQKKKNMRRHMIEGNADRYYDDYFYDDDGPDLEGKWRKKKKRRRIIIICVFLAIILAIVAAFLINRYYKFSSYELVWEKPLNEGSFVGIEKFGDNIIKYSHDGAMYYDKSGTEIWVDSYEMNSPKAYVSGEYVCIADVGGNEINIYNKSIGLCGTAKTIQPITKAVVAENGTTAAIVEDNDAVYINFFSKDGSSLDITIKTIMGGDGYPVDIALSPEGTQLLAAFSYIEGGQLKSKAVFYDFSEIGKNIPNRLVGGFEEPFAEAMIARVRFINSTYSYAIADNGIYFFSSKNLSSPELIKEIKFENAIESVVHSANHVGLVIQNLEGDHDYSLVLYTASGEETIRLEFDDKYTYVSCDDKYIYFTGEDSCMFVNMQGIVKYDGEIDELARFVTTGTLPGRFVFTNASFIREYQFK